jgi:hypothetical protein
MQVVRNTVEDVKFIITTMVCSVFVVVWHYERHQPIKEKRKADATTTKKRRRTRLNNQDYK